MNVKNDYDNTLTNIAASVQEYFGVKPVHNTFVKLDEMFKRYNPEKVVIILLDGLGANNLKRLLSKDAFLRKNLLCELTTVFPATTAAATTSLRTGLNPAEHGYVGWTAYIEPIDKVITLFANSEKGNNDEICEEFVKVKDDLLGIETITEQICKDGEAVEVLPFGADCYEGLDGMMKRILEETRVPGKKYIYAYSDEPDTTMHEEGPDSESVKKLVISQDAEIKKLAEQLHDTLLIVLTDHGHIKTRTLYLEDYPDILELMACKTSVDQRAAVFKIKKGKKREFVRLFNEHFGEYYDLFSAEEVRRSRLFGDGKEHPLFKSELGDYLAIAKGDVAITAPGDHYHVSHHAGYTDDEVMIPFVVKYCE